MPGRVVSRPTDAWSEFRRLLAYTCDREGTHFVTVEPAGTTQECARCGVTTEKPLWVREHSCHSCEFEVNRDTTPALTIVSRGLEAVEVGRSESPSEETALTVDTVVSAKRVVEAGSPVLNDGAKRRSRAG